MTEQAEAFLVRRAGELWGWSRDAITMFSNLLSSAWAQCAVMLANESPREIFFPIFPSKDRYLPYDVL